MRTAHTYLAIFTLVTMAQSAHGAIEFNYINIADTQGPFLGFQPPVINNLGQVASVAQQNYGGQRGLLFRGEGGALTPIANGEASGTMIAGFAINDSGVVAYVAWESACCNPGIFAGSGGLPVTIAEPKFSYSGIGIPTINNAGLVAAAINGEPPNGVSIVAGNGGDLETLADFGVNHLSLVWGPEINSAGTAVFVAYYPSLSGTQESVFVADGGTLNTLADTQEGWDLGFGKASINDTGAVSFEGSHPDTGEGIYVFSPVTGIEPILTDLTEAGAFFEQPSINNQGHVALKRNRYDGVSLRLIYSIFLHHQGANDVVIESGDSLFGSTVTWLAVDGHYLNDVDQIAFYYALEDGRAGVARADPVPEPDAIIMLISGTTLLAGCHGRKGRTQRARRSNRRPASCGRQVGCSSGFL